MLHQLHSLTLERMMILVLASKGLLKNEKFVLDMNLLQFVKRGLLRLIVLVYIEIRIPHLDHLWPSRLENLQC